MRANHADPSAPPSGTATQSTGRSVTSATACTHSVDPGAATRCDDALRGDAGVRDRGVERALHHERRRLVGGTHHRSRVVGEVEAFEHRAAGRVVERHALAARVRRPHRDRTGIEDAIASSARTGASPSRGTCRPRCSVRPRGSCPTRCAGCSRIRGPRPPRRPRPRRSTWCRTARARHPAGRPRPRAARPSRRRTPTRARARRRRCGPPPTRWARGAAAGPSGSRAGRASCSSHPTQSNRGCASAAVVVSSTASPLNAWLATACAGQRPCASGASPASQRTNPRNPPDASSAPPPPPSGSPVRPRSSPYSNPG